MAFGLTSEIQDRTFEPEAGGADMMTKVLLVFLFGWFLAGKVSLADDVKEPAATAPKEPGKPLPSPEELEAKFKAMLTKATLSGRWAPIKDGALGAEKEDKYNIVSVGKITGDSWVVNARMQYREREFVAPIPVKVKWAGDTPVLIVDNFQLPGSQNFFSARVLFYEHTYAGTWSGGDHGGLLSGVISNEKEEIAK
jgi:hypothetical protein